MENKHRECLESSIIIDLPHIFHALSQRLTANELPVSTKYFPKMFLFARRVLQSNRNT